MQTSEKTLFGRNESLTSFIYKLNIYIISAFLYFEFVIDDKNIILFFEYHKMSRIMITKRYQSSRSINFLEWIQWTSRSYTFLNPVAFSSLIFVFFILILIELFVDYIFFCQHGLYLIMSLLLQIENFMCSGWYISH